MKKKSIKNQFQEITVLIKNFAFKNLKRMKGNQNIVLFTQKISFPILVTFLFPLVLHSSKAVI